MNELHTYFPAILYQRQRFTSVQNVLEYMEQQMRGRYDLFSMWQNYYNTNNPLAPPYPVQEQQPQPQPQPQAYQPQQQQQGYYRSRNSRRWYPRNSPMPQHEAAPSVHVTFPADSLQTNTNAATSDQLVTSILNTYMPNDEFSQFIIRSLLIPPSTGNTTTLNPQTQAYWDPVVVAPTATQIAAASSTYAAPTRLDTPCAICQDTIAEGDQVRKLNHCDHFFHRSCVDTWFQRNVRCPVCRHDIRSRAVRAVAPAPLTASAQT
jgi:hypothetical protein